MQKKSNGHQCINCHVNSCAYHDGLTSACTLSSIEVKPCSHCGNGKPEDETNCASYKSR